MSENQPTNPAKKWKYIGLGAATTVLGGTLGALLYGNYWLNEQLSPWLETELTKTLQRPVKLGQVERFSLSSVRFARSQVLPTATQKNFLIAPSIEVQLDLGAYWQKRQIGLDVVLDRPQVFLQQDLTSGSFLPTIPSQAIATESPIDLRTLKITRGQITLQPAKSADLVAIANVNVDSNWQITNSQAQKVTASGRGKVVLPLLDSQSLPDPTKLSQAIDLAFQTQKQNKIDLGNLTTQLQWDLTRGHGNVDLRSQNLSAQVLPGFVKPLKLPFSLTQGKLDSQINLQIAPEQLPKINGSVEIKNGSAIAQVTPKPLTQINGNLEFIAGSKNQANRVSVKGLVANYGKIQTKTNGTISDRFDLKIAIANQEIKQLLQEFNSPVNFKVSGAIATAATIKGNLDAPKLDLKFKSTKSVTIDKVSFSQVQGRVSSTDFQRLRLSDFQATPAIGGQVSGQGQINLVNRNLQLAFQVSQISAEKAAAWYGSKLPIAVGQVSAALQVFGKLSKPQVLAQFNAPQALYPAMGEVLIVDRKLALRDTRVQFPQGLAQVQADYNLTNGVWQANLRSDGIPLNSIITDSNIPDNQLIMGTVNLDSDGGFQPNQVAAQADLQIPQGLNLQLQQKITRIPEAISLKLNWDKQNLRVSQLQLGDLLSAKGKVDLGFDADKIPNRVTGIDLEIISRQLGTDRLRPFIPQLTAAGTIDFNGRLSGALERLNIDGDLRLSNLSLGKLIRVFVPQVAIAQGNLDFQGRVSGLVTSPQLVGDANISGLKLDRVAFAPNLRGAVSYSRQQGAKIDLKDLRKDRGDRLALNLNPDFSPKDFLVQLNQGQIKGVSQAQNKFLVDIQKFPLGEVAALFAPSQVTSQGIQGTITSQLNLDLSTKSPTAQGSIVVDRPRFGRIQAEQLTADLRYAQGKAQIRNGQASLGEAGTGSYGFELDVAPQSDTPIQGKLIASQGNLQDVPIAMQWFQLSDLTRGTALPNLTRVANIAPLQAIGLPNQPLYRQLEYFSQINAKLDREDAIRSNSLPPISQVKGKFDGSISFASSRQGISLGFDLVGSQWEYGKFAVDRVVAKGGIEKQVLSLQSLKLESGERFGEVSDAKVSLNLLTGRVSSLDLLVPQSGNVTLVNFPIEALRPFPFFEAIPVNLTGNVNGTATLSGTLLSPIANGKLEVKDATVNRQPLKSVQADFGLKDFQLKFNATALATGTEPLIVAGTYPIFGGNLDLAINVKDDGLGLINLIDPSLRWLSGKGNASLKVSGTTRTPKVAGQVSLDRSTFGIAGLPADLTDVTGTIDFGLDRVNTDLTGKFSDGKVKAKGLIAIADPNLEFETPLQVSADTLKLNLKDLYEGSTSGNVTVKGTIQAPILSGSVALSDGRVIRGSSGTEVAPASNPVNNASNPTLRFDRLLVKLTNNVQFVQLPLLNFLAEGELTVNGSLNNILPSGRINIIRGQVNAISTRFRLDRSYENYAIFTPEQGLNPSLNVRVAGVVPEITRTPMASSLIDTFNPTNVPVSAPGASRSLRVNATVTGSAQNPDIQLTSSPPRTQAEIVALIGGGLVQQGGGDPTAAIANLAGGTAIAFLQDLVGDVFSLSEFNLTPTTASPVGGKASSLGFVAEAAIDITRQFSFSVRGVINDPSQPTSYTVRYRLDPNTLVRTTTDLKGNNSASVEYETRF
jgi:translocation and assembly module TamB